MPTLDQMLLFVTVADTGSFSEAARRLDRVQSTISHGIAQLEKELGLSLFDRQRRKPVLSEAGIALLPEAKHILGHVKQWRGHAESLQAREEAEVSLVLDMILPTPWLIESLKRLKHHVVASAVSERSS